MGCTVPLAAYKPGSQQAQLNLRTRETYFYKPLKLLMTITIEKPYLKREGTPLGQEPVGWARHGGAMAAWSSVAVLPMEALRG